MRTHGDPGAIQRRLAYFGGPQFPEDASRAIVAAGLKQIQDGFNASRDPYGDSWAPLHYRRGKPLEKTGRLYRSAYGRALGGGHAEVGLTANYAGFHQDGTNGHESAPRFQPVNKRGRFISREAAGRYKRSVRVRYVRGAQVGAITKRPMVPDERGLPPRWGEAFDASVELLVDRKLESL